jgi:hypothetical protein
MNCESANKSFSLFLYGELSIEEEQEFQDHIEACAGCGKAFEAEKKIHRALEGRELTPPAALLARCRRDLHARVEAAAAKPRWFAWFTHPWPGLAAAARPAGALALVALGFFGARWTTPASTPGIATTSDPVVSRVRYVQPEGSGKVQLVIEETRQRMMTGDLADDGIRRLLLAAAREGNDATLRAESVDLLRGQPGSTELRSALLYAVQHDPNPGVRLKALDALKVYTGDAEVRGALARVLLADDNPGVRTQAVDLLVQKKEEGMVGVLQELVQKDSNDYVRQRCQKALQDMNASVGTF